MPQWTKEQQLAIDWRGCHTLVSAGAGSGKTAVLIQRILSRITDVAEPLDVDRLLVLTFTNAAAAQMRHRMGKALYEALANDPGNGHLQRQLVLLQRAQITTLHSFCLDTIKKYFYLLDLDPKARIGNAGELLMLRDKVLDDLFESAYGQADSPLVLLLNHYNRGLGDDTIRELVLQIAEFSYSMAEPEAWLQALLRPYEENDVSQWLDYAARQIQEEVTEAANTLAKAADLCSQPENGLEKYEIVIKEEASAVAACLHKPDRISQQTWDEWLKHMNSIEFKRLPTISKKTEYNATAKDLAAVWRNEAKAAVRKIQQQYGSKTYVDFSAEAAALQPIATALVQLTQLYLEQWQNKKKEKKLLEFQDLEHFCLALLNDPQLDVAAQLKKQFAEVFVDEYQDINQVQEAILEAVSCGDNRFMVGDIKQSIYRFRMAEPALFLDKYVKYGNGQGGKRIDLQKNFRSQANIIGCVNFLFRQLLVGQQTEITYDQAAELVAGNESATVASTEVVIIDQKNFQAGEREQDSLDASEDEEDAVDLTEEYLAAETEAQVIIGKIKEQRGNGKKFSDMVILLRSLKNWAPVIAEQLGAAGIPCKAEGTIHFYESAEIETITNLLKIIDNPLQDIELAAVLHSPIVGLCLKELADVRLLAPGLPFWQAVKQCADERVVCFLQRLEQWRQMAKEGSITELVRGIYRQTGLVQMMAALPDGSIKQANLEQFLLMAQEYDRDSYKGLYRFLLFLARNKEQQQAAMQYETTPDAVTIMSIHRSKGLEFPVVFVAGLGRKFNDSDTRKDILLHRNLGLGLRHVDLEKRLKYPTLGYAVLADKVNWETKAEELRILYVALTRAKENLILIGSCRNLDSLLTKNSGICLQQEWGLSIKRLEKNSTYLGWILLALLRHEDGGCLRQRCGAEEPLPRTAVTADESCWDIQILDRLTMMDLPAELQQEASSCWQAYLTGQPLPLTAVDPLVTKNLDWQYPWRVLSQLPVKWSATSLGGLRQQTMDWQEDENRQKRLLEGLEDMAVEQEAQPSTPANKKPANWYADLGTLVHALLEQVDLQALAAGGSAAAQMETLLAQSQASMELKNAVDVNAPARFFDTEIGKELLQAVASGRQVLREASFTLGITIAELAEVNSLSLEMLGQRWQLPLDRVGKEQVFLQGVIDLAYQNTDGWVLVDYKTGKNYALTDGGVREKYLPQLLLYEKALRGICGGNVNKKAIYFTQNNRLVDL